MNEDKVVFVDCECTGLDPDRNEIWELAIVSNRKLLSSDAVWYERTHPGEEVHAGSFPRIWYVHEWMFPVDLSKADPFALDVGRFHERRGGGYRTIARGGSVLQTTSDVCAASFSPVERRRDHAPVWEPLEYDSPNRETHLRTAVAEISEVLRGKHIVGAVPSFDAAFLRRFLHKHQQFASWHYHLIDVEALAVGYLAAQNTCESDPLPLPWNSNDLSRAMGVKPDDFERHTALGDALWAKAIYDVVMKASEA